MVKLFKKQKDGGSESNVEGYFLIEWKGLFSIALLKFNKGARVAYHTHAFNAYTWFLFGDMKEERLYFLRSKLNDKNNINLHGIETKKYKFSLFPKYTSKINLHRVVVNKTSWCFTIRGKWDETWFEVDKKSEEELSGNNDYNAYSEMRTYTHGRVVKKKSKAFWKFRS